jgi:hypothetical protein
MDERIATFKVQMSDRNNLKDVALGTSKYVPYVPLGIADDQDQLHRPSNHSLVVQEIRCSPREAILKDSVSSFPSFARQS